MILCRFIAKTREFLATAALPFGTIVMIVLIWTRHITFASIGWYRRKE
ncbi:hypothetical protein CsSME_00006375 [Camellia sinensis var. sinensis]